MNSAVAIVVCSVFVVLALWHFYMAFRGSSGESATVPSLAGKPLFVPSAVSTVAVGVVLVLFAVLVAATSGMLSLGVPPRLLAWLSYGLALGLFARAVGEFKYVGFFKRCVARASPQWTRYCTHPCVFCCRRVWQPLHSMPHSLPSYLGRLLAEGQRAHRERHRPVVVAVLQLVC
jgi:Protein of unknown function (DUF3995)